MLPVRKREECAFANRRAPTSAPGWGAISLSFPFPFSLSWASSCPWLSPQHCLLGPHSLFWVRVSCHPHCVQYLSILEHGMLFFLSHWELKIQMFGPALLCCAPSSFLRLLTQEQGGRLETGAALALCRNTDWRRAGRQSVDLAHSLLLLLP